MKLTIPQLKAFIAQAAANALKPEHTLKAHDIVDYLYESQRLSPPNTAHEWDWNFWGDNYTLQMTAGQRVWLCIRHDGKEAIHELSSIDQALELLSDARFTQ